MQLSDRKGLEKETIVYTILALVFLIGAIVLWTQIKEAANASIDIDVCRTSVLEKAKFIIAGFDIADVTLRCPTEKINLIDKRDDKIKNEQNIIVENQEDVQKVIAGEMFDCWYKFGNGRVDFIEGFNVAKRLSCYVCSDIRFSDKAKQNTAIGNEVKNFESYLVRNKVPGRNVSYYEYFGGKIDFTNKELAEINIKIDRPLAVAYYVVSKSAWNDISKSVVFGGEVAAGVFYFTANPLISAAAGTIATGVNQILNVAGQEARPFVAVIPLEDARQCEVL